MLEYKVMRETEHGKAVNNSRNEKVLNRTSLRSIWVGKLTEPGSISYLGWFGAGGS